MLWARDVSFGYGESTLFRRLNLEVTRGQRIGVVGRSGTGKSSLLYVLSGLKRPTEGTVYFLGKDLWSQPADLPEIRRRHFGFIFQQHFLINYLTVLENVLVPSFRPQTTRERAADLLNFIGMTGLEDRFPYQLSGGQRQRVAVARALINDPDIIFADEPTASLDESTAESVLSLLYSYQNQKNCALILVTHDRRLLKGFSNLVDFENSGGEGR